MTRPVAKGWCPGAYRPMMSGDGLVVRVRPIMARVTADQALGLCNLSVKFGSGLIDLTSRANLQIRGVREENHEALLQELNALDLLPDDPALEARRNILIAPDWRDGDVTERLAKELYARLAELPELPAKFGFAVDTGDAPAFHENSADIRIERSGKNIVVRADGCAKGRAVAEAETISAAIEMAHWFAETGGATSRRMAQHVKTTPLPADWQTASTVLDGSMPEVGQTELGTYYGAPFGQIESTQLSELVKTSGCRALRVTPWRLFMTEDAAPVKSTAFVTDPDDPLLNVDACPGAPLCTSSTVETREIAKKLAASTNARLHVSGCSKGCARPRKSEMTLVGHDGRFDLVKNGLPWDEPSLTGLSPKDLLDRIGEF